MGLIPFRGKEDDLLEPRERSLFGLRNAMDSLFDRFMRTPWSGFDSMSTAGWPGGLKADLSETDDAVTVEIEAPGVDPKNIEINVTGQTLTVRGEKSEDKETKRRNYHFIERQFGSFQRTIPLPASVNADAVDARFRDGVLSITLPKRPEAKPKRITVKTGGGETASTSGGGRTQPKEPAVPTDRR